jgi:hypothetical protein
MKNHFLSLASALAAWALIALASPATAATMSASPDAPVVDGEDIANLTEATGTDKWFTGTDAASSAKGQSFTTGGAALRLKSITYQVDETQKAEPTKTYAIRLGKLANSAFTLVHSENATQSFTWKAGEFMTWTFATPVLLDPYTTYGIDVGMKSSTSGWQTGIPYIKFSADEYSGGERYSSGTSGTGTATVSYAVGSDRVFHLDIERPLGPVFELVAKSPADDTTDALATRELVLTFSQNVTSGSGHITFRDLTDPLNPVDTLVAADDPRLTYDQNVVRIEPAGLLDWSKTHAIRLDAGVFLGDGGAPIAAIADDSTWNFTTAAGDPFLDAIAAIKNHITGAVTLTGAQIAAHKSTIDAAKARFDESSATISAVFDLVKTYDTAKGPLFVSGSAVTGFSRTNTTPTSATSISPENVHWVVYGVMQSIMDEIYNAESLANPVKRALIANFNDQGGYKFGSHTDFPGPCAPPADSSNSHAVAINGSFPITFGRSTQMWTNPARKPTGTYLAPGTIASVTVPPALVNKGYKVRVGAHSWDLSGRPPVERLERATRLYPLDAETIEVASPYGGGIYIEVPIGADAGVVNVTITGAVRAPYFSAKPFHQTTVGDWNTERAHLAPWADFQSEKFMMQVPRKWIYNMTGAQAVQLMADWDKAMDAINSLMGFPLDRGKETMYCQTDVILRSSVHAPGYPAVNVSSNVNSEVSPAGYAGSYLVRGPGASPTAANIEFHEQGHAYFFPKFGGETESAVNLLQPAMLHREFGYSLDVAHAGSLGSSSVHRTLDNTAVAWMCCFSFSPNEIPMAALEKQYQHKGHAKFLDIVRLFGWGGLDAFWRSFMEDDAAGVSYANTDDEKLLRLSRSVGKDLRPLFHFWGVHPQNPAALAAAIAAENIPASLEIRDLLLHYKTLVPADNAAYQAFMLNWWGKKPSVAGYWEETDHAMQWDETLDADGTNNPSVRPTITIGSKYVEGCAAEIRARVDELVAMYFPSGITPDPMGFADAPQPLDAATIGMTATAATAPVGPVEYRFENTTTGTARDWSDNRNWNQSGLIPGQTYSFRVRARNGLGEETSWSPTLDATITPTGTPFELWTEDFAGLTDANPALDFDGGGLATGIEWVLGGDPTTGSDDASLAPTIDTTSNPDGKTLFVFRRSSEAGMDAGTTIQVQYGSDLDGWTTALHEGTAANQITITGQANGFGSGIDRITVALPAGLAAGGKLFARLNVVVAGE